VSGSRDEDSTYLSEEEDLANRPDLFEEIPWLTQVTVTVKPTAPHRPSPHIPAQDIPDDAPSLGSQVRSTPPDATLRKLYRCPKFNCIKSYKQAHGLKYHVTHGRCIFASPKDLKQDVDGLRLD